VTRTELVELSDLNFRESTRELSRRAHGTVLDEPGLLLFAGGHPLPVLANGVFRTTTAVSAREVLQRTRQFFAQQRRGFTVFVRAHADEDLQAALEAEGLTAMGSMPAMILDHRLPAAAAPPGVELRRVSTPADARAYADVQSAAYATYGMRPDVAPALLPNLATLLAPHIAAFLAVLEGRPAAGAMTIVTHGVAGVYWVGTIPEARGRGLAELCTRAAGNAGFDLGGRIASLQASVMGEPVYRRMGYVEVTRYPYFVQMQPPAAPAPR
jgi:ribosomal protein S18 acetylase RimI-like enzyme